MDDTVILKFADRNVHSDAWRFSDQALGLPEPAPVIETDTFEEEEIISRVKKPYHSINTIYISLRYKALHRPRSRYRGAGGST